jgi:hypothetical protein
MFGLFRSPRPKAHAHRVRRAQLQLEQLEERDCPAAPSISGLAATKIGTFLAIQGTLSDDSPATARVSFSGAVTPTITPDASGWFGFVVPYGSGTQLTAVATDSQNQTSPPVTANISCPTDANPFITFTVTYGQQRQIMIIGKVYDESPGGRTVTISGMASGTATTDPAGNFCLALTATGLGTISASTTDPAGNASNTPIVTLTSNAPQITNFTGSEEQGDWYEFTGRVLDESPTGLTLYLGGAPVSLSGASCTVRSDGTFDFRVQLTGTTTDDGVATAMVTDWWGLTSNTATWTVSQTGV